MDSKDYWKKREQDNLAANIKTEAEYRKELQRIYTDAQAEIQRDIEAFYGRYAGKEGITMAEARKRASELDIEAYSEKAKKYVAEKNFSARANEEMRLYNLTMKVNRLELLKAEMGLELAALADEQEALTDKALNERTRAELERQAGILGKTLLDNAKAVNSIVNASFKNATYSERIWANQAVLKQELGKLLTSGIIQGKNPRELASRLRKVIDTSAYNANRLLITELARVQTEAQKQSFERNGFDQYTYISCSDFKVCEICKALDGKHFDVDKMMPGENAPPVHPNCRCSTAAYIDDKAYNEWLSTYNEHEISWQDWKNRQRLTDVTQEYLRNARQKTGNVKIDKGVNLERNKHDIEIARWLRDTFGGDIRVMEPVDKYRHETPDYDWRGSKWELKTPTSRNAIDKRLQKAGHQLGVGGGGIVVDISNLTNLTRDESVDWIEKKIPKRAKGDVDLIIMQDKELIKVIRYKKK